MLARRSLDVSREYAGIARGIGFELSLRSTSMNTDEMTTPRGRFGALRSLRAGMPSQIATCTDQRPSFELEA
jgi:hypothetical protein